MKILIVSSESWRETNNGGNVLSNIFGAFPDAEIAQVYCSGELPENGVCRKYFQISDTMLLRDKGRRLEERDYSYESSSEAVAENRIKKKIPKLFKESALLAREVLWSVINWRTEGLRQFVKEFAPDVIFAPCYSYFHVSKLALYIKSIAGCPMISYISDDNYSLKQLRFSPSFWINRLITRKWIRRHFAQCSLVYTMTEMQRQEYQPLMKCPMKVLCKSAEFEDGERPVGNPVKFIYAGGLYLNRWRVLARLSRAIEAINKDAHKAELHIYSGSVLKAKERNRIHDGSNSFLHGPLPYEELRAEYKRCDVAIHVESFDLKNRLITRLSFSTKIIDCLESGCAVLAIGPENQAGIAYLKNNDAAICIPSLDSLQTEIESLVGNSIIVQEYAQKAKQLGRKNHIKELIDESTIKDFCEVVNSGII